MPSNISVFNKQLNDFQRKLGRRFKALIEFSETKALDDLKLFSPVKTGNFVNNWVKIEPGEAVQPIGVGLRFKNFFIPSIIFANDTPYGLEVIPDGFVDPETGMDQGGEIGLNAGRSQQAPAGIIAPWVSKFTNEWPTTVEVAKRVVP